MIHTRYTSLALITCLLINGLSKAQEPVRVNLNQRITDDHFTKTQAILPVFWFDKEPFEGHKNFGIKPNKKSDNENFNIRFPEMSHITDTGYTYLFFGEAPSPPQGFIFCIVGKNQPTEPYTLIWIDRNQNLDLNDDGPPDTFYNTPQNYLDISIPNPRFNHAYHLVRISRFSPQKSKEYQKLADQHIEKNSGNKRFAGTHLSFREQRLNIKSTQYKNQTDSFRISIQDRNINGLYNDKDFDVIILNHYNSNEAGTFEFSIDEKQNTFEWNQKTYEIIKIEPGGEYIEFKYRPDIPAQRQLKRNKRIPRFKYQPAEPDSKPKSVRKYKGKPLFIYIYNENTPNLDQDTLALGMLQRNHSDEVQVLMINYGDPLRKVIGWKYRNKNLNTIGIIDQKTAQKLQIHQEPTTFFLCKKQRVCEINLTSQQVLEHYKQK